MQSMDQTGISLRHMLRRTLAALCVLLLPVVALGAPFAYITNQIDDNVSVIDTATNTVTATIAVGDFPDAVAFNPAGTRVYVTNRGDATVSVINTTTNTTVATVSVGVDPRGVVVNPAGTRVYVANNGSNTVTVFDAGTNTVVATIPVGSFPQGIAINAAGTRVYVANYGDDTVSIIDTATDTVIGGPLAVGNGPLGIAVNPAGTRLYVGNSLENVNAAFEGTVSVIETTGNTIIATVTVGQDPYGIVVSPNGSRVYVANCCAQSVSVMETTGNTVIATLSVGNNPAGISINQDGSRVYVANLGDDTVSIIDTATLTVLGTTVTVGNQPQAFGNFIGPGVAPSTDNTPTDPIPALPTLPGVPGIGTQPTALNLGGGQGPTLTDCLLATARKLFGNDATYLGQNANGVARISINGSRVIAFYPLQASTGTPGGEGIHLTGSNVLNVGTSCGNFNVAPALANLAEFGTLISGMGLTASINTQGVLTLVVGEKVYAARPDYLSRLGLPGTAQAPSLVLGPDGAYRFTDSAGTVQILLPAFLDTDALAIQASAQQGGWIHIDADGTALFTLFNGLRFLLTADMTLNRVGPENAALLSWQDGPRHYQFRGSTLVLAQGVSLQAR
ncbi:MAG: YncE family protein [Pseudomonadota bacterium]